MPGDRRGRTPLDLTIRERASAIAAGLQAGSPAHRFYGDLVNRASASMREAAAEDEEWLDQA